MGNRAFPGILPDLRSTVLSSSPWWTSDLTASLLVALAYYFGCLTGFALRFPSSGIAYIWPPNAILLVAFLLLKPRVWPLALAASLGSHGVAHAQDGLPAAMWIWLFAGNAAQAVLAAILVRRFSDRPLQHNTLRSVTVFIGGAALAAPAISSLIPAYIYAQMGWASDYWSAWGMRTLTNVVTTVTLVPPLVAIFGEHHRGLKGLRVERAAEFVLLLLGLAAVELAAFALPRSALSGLPLALSASMPFLVWAAARFGAPGLSTCLLLVAHLSIHRPAAQNLPAGVSAAQMIMGIQMFIGITASPFMFLSAALEEREHTRRAETALYHSEAKNTAILRALPDLMFLQTKDSEHRYVDYYCLNRGDLLAPPEQFLGKRMSDVLPPDLAARFEELFASVVASGETGLLEYALPIHGEHRFYEARVVPCDDDRLLSIVRDITVRKRAEAALQKAQQELARMGRASALGELAGSIAHEVQQPLGAIGANAAACLQWLDQDEADLSQLANALTDIVHDTERASHVIRRTRELFGSGQRENAPVELNSAIVEVLALARHRPERNGESVRSELEDVPLWVLGDRVQLQQVLLNLVVNGLQAMSRVPGGNGSVVVRSWREKRFVHVAVCDAGPGFDPDDVDRIFDPFYTTKADGLGIGLSISRSIISAHGGRLQARLNEGGGATFEFAVPAAPDTVAATDAA
jgi:two-component system, LuxR family, sensor kinase FixL